MCVEKMCVTVFRACGCSMIWPVALVQPSFTIRQLAPGYIIHFYFYPTKVGANVAAKIGFNLLCIVPL